MKISTLYFSWLQKDNPTGKPDILPELENRFETSVPGIYCIGDLTGIPLIKLAAESGLEAIEQLEKSSVFKSNKARNLDPDMYDVCIAGAGPAGISAAIRCHETGLRYIVIESSRIFSTIRNFPDHKPIYITPAIAPFKSRLVFTDGTKETLLEQLETAARKYPLVLHERESVRDIQKQRAGFIVKTDKGSYKALYIVVAIGKSGTARTLSVAGVNLPKTFTHLVDPSAHFGKDIIVVGGGDSAVEAAVGLARYGNAVTLSYRKKNFSKVKKQNLDDFNDQVKRGCIKPIFNSEIKRIEEKTVTLSMPDGEKTIPNEVIYTMIGSEIPKRFLKRAKIKIAGERHLLDYMALVFTVMFASMVFFGKSEPSASVRSVTEFINLQMHFLNFQSIASVKSGGGWLGFCGTALLGSILLIILIKLRSRFFSSVWNVFKYSYFSLIVAFFLFIYISYNLNGTMPLGRHPGYWYTLLFTLTMIIFGIRRMYTRPTGYVIRQTIALLAIQTMFLCILPLYVFPWLGDNGFFNAWIMHNVFPDHSYWRSFGFILAWPLFMANLASGQPSSFWLIVSLIQTFVVIPVLVFFWGKGSYCGWICSCGGLAETLGDEYRMKAPHGPSAKRMENAGQIILWFAFIATLVSLCTPLFPFRFGAQSQFIEKTYTLAVDIVCSGVIGMGFYFFLSGRVWCRFFCPLAGLMHLYARFSRFRIMANKNRCISCAICTASCHMGIDVMNYANKGIPMNDVECVRCSACITQCPLQVLTFGKTGLWDIDNKKCKTRHFPLARGWKSGLPKKQIEMLLREEADQRDRKIDLS